MQEVALEMGPECGRQVSKQHSTRGKGLAMWSRVTVGGADIRTVLRCQHH